jgi:Fic family protein
MYNWQLPNWPDFKFELAEAEAMLYAFAEETGYVTGILKTLDADVQLEAIVNVMAAEAIKTSEIEGEYLNRQDVMSSIRNKFGLNQTPDIIKDKRAEGAGALMFEVRSMYNFPLTEEMLFEWHELLMLHNKHINAGTWRKDDAPMQIVSGAVGKETVHFEAPPSAIVPAEMKRFIQWFNDTSPEGKHPISKAPVRAAIAHLYFESIHPFEDGNGRIGRAIAEKALSQTLGRPLLISISRVIEEDRDTYYGALKAAQRSNEITHWINYFVSTILAAQREAVQLIDFTFRKAKFFDYYRELNARQLKVINKMMDAGPAGFEGGMSANKYISITRASKATATRDLQELAELGALKPEGGGRSTRYVLNI